MADLESMKRTLGLFCAVCLSSAAVAAVPVVESQGTPVRGAQSTAPRASQPSAAQSYPAQSYPAQTSTVQSYPAESYPAESYPAESYPAATTPVTVTQSYPTPAAAAVSPMGGASMSPQSELFSQLQTLQVEVQELRGVIEEQRHLIDRLERQQKEQYLDLDRRMTALRESAPIAGTSQGSSGSTAPAGTTSRPSAPPASERDAYTAAFNLTRDKRFDEAIAAFNQQLVDYPNGEYAGNAFYWLGELYLALPTPDLEKSRQSFDQIVGQFPNHAKVPDALYKLGVVYHRLGNNARAKEYLDQTQRRFPGTPAARLAQSYVTEIR